MTGTNKAEADEATFHERRIAPPPYRREEFHTSLRQAITTPVQKLAQKRTKHELSFVAAIVSEAILIQIDLQEFFTRGVINSANTSHAELENPSMVSRNVPTAPTLALWLILPTLVAINIQKTVVWRSSPV